MYLLKIYAVKTLRKMNLLPKINFTLLKKYNGKNIIIPFLSGIGLSNMVLIEDWFDSLINEFLTDNDTGFVDVGVNVGQTLIKVKTKFPNMPFLGFEPNATCVEYVQQLIKKNQFDKCIVYNCALSSRTKAMVLEKSFAADPRASFVSSFRPGYFSDKEYVLAIDYDSLFSSTGFSFVKIDVEGGELEVIQGMKSSLEKYQPIITCEVLDCHSAETFSFTQDRANLLTSLLSSIDYGVIRLKTENMNRLLDYNIIEEIIIKQWTVKSYSLNDYVFYPKNRERNVVEKLNRVVSK